MAGATGSTITYDAKTKKATVILTDGYEVTFDPNAKNSGVTIKDGRMMIDNEKFDKQMTGVRKQKDKTEIYAFVDTAVAGDKVAAVTLVSRTTGKKVESLLIPSLKVDEMKVIRNTRLFTVRRIPKW